MLTSRQVDSAKPKPDRYEIPDGNRLYLVVQPSGRKSWVIRYRHNGQTRKLSLGNYPTMQLAKARRKARDIHEQVDQGRDPAREKREAREARKPSPIGDDTFKWAVDNFMARVGSTKKSGHEIQRVFNKYVLPHWGERQLDQLGRRDVVALLDYVEDHHGPVQADRVLAWVRRVFNWLVARGDLELSPVVKGMGRAGPRKRKRWLNDGELVKVWHAIDDLTWPFKPIFQLLMLTGQRRSEVAGLRWADVDLDERLWTIPDPKNGRSHAVPLSDAAVEIITGLPRVRLLKGGDSPLCFPSNRTEDRPASGFGRPKAAIDAALGPDFEPWCLHDLRRSFRTHAPRLGIGRDIGERILNHAPVQGVEAVYDLHDYLPDKRLALQKWADHIAGLVSGGAQGKVIKLDKFK